MTSGQAILDPLALLSTKVREPVYALDAEGRIVFLNRACEALLGLPASEVLGHTCLRQGTDDSQPRCAVLATLCPPPEVRQGQSLCVLSQLRTAEGQAIERPITFFPCHDAGGELLYILALVGPQTSAPVSALPLGPDLQAELQRVRSRLVANYGFEKIIFQGPAMQRVIEQAKTAAACDVPVLVSGERGTGKELIARAIHYASPRREAPFSPIDCAALSPEMLDRTLSWLDRSYDGLSAAYSIPAAGRPGTVYLEELLALPRDFQARIVPLVQPEAHTRQAGEEPRRLPRLIASTTSDLQDAVAKGSLREDLFYRITPLRIDLPPLRQRREDIPLLAQHFLELQNDRADHQVGSLEDEAVEVLTHYEWPGNVRELAETMAQAHTRATTGKIQVQDLPLRLRSAYDAASSPPVADELPMKLDELLERVETKIIRLALQRSRGNKSRAADFLGISRPRLYRRMDVLGIEEDGVEE